MLQVNLSNILPFVSADYASALTAPLQIATTTTAPRVYFTNLRFIYLLTPNF